MDLFPFLFPGKAQKLASHQYAAIVNESLLEKNYELERKIDKLNAEKRAFEYFKRVLVEDGNLVHKTFTNDGRLALVESKTGGTICELCVYLEEANWHGVQAPRPACTLSYETMDNGIFIIDIVSHHSREKGAGMVVIETLIKLVEDFMVSRIRGDLAVSDLEQGKDRLLDFYAKFGFTVRLYDKAPMIGGDVFKVLYRSE